MKSILITGSYGQLGEACIKHLKSNFNLFISDSVILGNGMHLDITDEKTVDQVLAETNPDIILNLAAMTDVDECENNPSLARAINVDGVKNLCNGFKGHFIQISTDYVFDGRAGPYSELDKTNPISPVNGYINWSHPFRKRRINKIAFHRKNQFPGVIDKSHLIPIYIDISQTISIIKNSVPIIDGSWQSSKVAGTGTPELLRAEMIRYSRSMACADGRSLPGGFLRKTYFLPPARS